MPIKVTIDNLEPQVKKMLSDYSAGLFKATEEAVRKVANNSRNKLRKRTPVHKGPYPEGSTRKPGTLKRAWQIKYDYKRLYVTATIHAGKQHGLTHLLEYGHALPQGGRTGPDPFIGTTQKEANDELLDEIMEAII